MDAPIEPRHGIVMMREKGKHSVATRLQSRHKREDDSRLVEILFLFLSASVSAVGDKNPLIAAAVSASAEYSLRLRGLDCRELAMTMAAMPVVGRSLLRREFYCLLTSLRRLLSIIDGLPIEATSMFGSL
jgi:hypothetical protein